MHPDTQKLLNRCDSFKAEVFFTIRKMMPPNNPAAQEAFDVWQHAAEMSWKHPENADVARCAEEAKAALVEAYGESAKPWARVPVHLRAELVREYSASQHSK